MQNQENNIFNERFETVMEEKRPIYNKNGQQLMLASDEDFRQCYAPDKPARDELPKYWFLSNKRHLISVEKKEPRFLDDDAKNRNGRGRYQFIKPDGTRASIEASALQALVFGSYIYGDAKRILEKEGLNAFGRSDNPDALNTHHAEGKEKQAAEDLEIVKSSVHKALHKKPKTEQEKIQYMMDLGKITANESPGKTVIVTDGLTMNKETGEWSDNGRIEIRDDVQISFSENGLRSLLELLSNAPVKIDVTE